MILQLSNYFFRAAPEDLKIINYLCDAFQHNKRTRSLIGNPYVSFQLGLKTIIAYCYFMVKKLGGIFISSNRSTYLLYYKKSTFYSSLLDRFHYLYMALFIIGIRQLPRAYQREKQIKSIRQNAIRQNGDQDYWYIWFLAQNQEEKSIKGLVEVKAHILQLAKYSNLAVYMETTEERLLPMYRRVGFEFYAIKDNKTTGIKVWFGRMVNR